MSTEAHARSSDPSTSQAAARSLKTSELEGVVLAKLKTFRKGATSDELARALGLSRDSVSPRMKPLVSKGHVVDSGKKRPGDSGRAQIVWRVFDSSDLQTLIIFSPPTFGKTEI